MKVKHPFVFLAIYSGIGILLYIYGIVNGSLALLDITAGTLIYTAVTH